MRPFVWLLSRHDVAQEDAQSDKEFARKKPRNERCRNSRTVEIALSSVAAQGFKKIMLSTSLHSLRYHFHPQTTAKPDYCVNDSPIVRVKLQFLYEGPIYLQDIDWKLL